MVSFIKRITGQLLMVTLLLPLMTMSVYAQSPAAEQGPGARNPDEVRIYYSEPIGAGDKVMQITGCKKVQAYAGVACNDFTKDISTAQCVDNKTNKVQTGKLIKGCIKPKDEQDFPEGDPRAKYPVVDAESIAAYDRNDPCRTNPSENAYLYGPVLGVAIVRDANGNELTNSMEWKSLGIFPVQDEKVPPTKAQVLKEFKSSLKEEDIKLVPLYKPTVCGKFDVLAGDNPGSPEAMGGITLGQLTELFKAEGGGQSYAPDFVAKEFDRVGCNSDNSTGKVGDIEQSTFYDQNPSFTCSILERITGRSGSDLFGRYVSALYRWAASVVGIIAVLVMVISGIQISVAGSDSGKIEEAKGRIAQSLVGLAILFLSGLILYTINPGFFTG